MTRKSWRWLVGASMVILGVPALLSGPACSSSSDPAGSPVPSASAGHSAGGHAGASGGAGAGAGASGGAGKAGGGKGGSGGSSGSASTSQCLSSEPEWLCNPELWKTVKIPGNCGIRELDLSKKPLPKREWQECGEGCQEAVLKLPFAKGAYFDAHGATVDGVTYLRSTMGWPDWGKGQMTTVHRVQDGETVSATLAYASCVSAREALNYDLIYWQNNGVATVGRFVPSDGSIRWFNYTFDGTAMGVFFSIDEGFGFTAGGSGIGLLDHVDDQFPNFIDADGSHYTYTGAGWGQLAVWPQHSVEGSRIRAFNWPGAIVTYLETPGQYIQQVALSDQHLAWLVVKGPGMFEGSYEEVELSWTKRPIEDPWPTGVVPKINLGAKLPFATGPLHLRVGGGYAASGGCSENYEPMKQCRVAVVHLATGKLWEIFPRDGKGWGNVLDINGSKILLSEADEENFGKAQYDRILWLDLDKLDQHAARWKP